MRSRVCRPEKPKKRLKHFFKTHEKRNQEAIANREPKKLDFVYPVNKPIRHKEFLVFDLESKKLDLQTKGFERPFMACTYDGTDYRSYRNDARHAGRSYKDEFWHEEGGCIDSMMRDIFGLRACVTCKIEAGEDKFGSCSECIAARKKYQSKNWIIYAHNFGKFDGLYVRGWLARKKHLFTYEIINVQSRMLILTVRLRKDAPGRSKSESWTFSDSIALIPLSLKEIGKTFFSDREDSQKIGFDLDLPEDHEDWDAYNKRDCDVLHQALCRFRDLVETIGGTIGMTAASTAMQIYRRRFQVETVRKYGLKTTKPIVIHRNLHFSDCPGTCGRLVCEHHECALERMPCHGCLHDFVREGFFGGRTEIYTMFGRNLFYYDLNSSYPASMLKDMPVGPARVLKEGTPWRFLEQMNKHSIGFVECVVYIPENCYLPPLPYRFVTEGGSKKLVFPAGQLYGVWNFEELQLVFEVGGKIIDIGKSVWYKRKKIFVDFVHSLYAYRKHKKSCPTYHDKEADCVCGYDEGMSYVAKLIMNSLYGKWGMNPLREKILELDDDIMSDPDFDLSLSILPPPNSELPARVQHVVEADYIVPQISATITAYSRITYFRGLNGALKETSRKIPGYLYPSASYRGRSSLRPVPKNFKGMVVYKNGHPYEVDMNTLVYGDTDSCTAKVPMKPAGSELGQWKEEEANIHMVVEQPKFYYYTRHKAGCRSASCNGCAPDKKGKVDKTRMKGVPRMDVDGNSLQVREVFDHLRKAADHTGHSPALAKTEEGEPELVFDRLMAVKAMIREDRTSPVMETVRRSMQSTYDKRRIRSDGTTMPLIINDPPTVEAARMEAQLRARAA